MKTKLAFIAALAVNVGFLSAPASAQSTKLEDMVLSRVDIQRNGATCAGSITYRFEVKQTILKADLGTTSRTLPALFPCANLDALLTYKNPPNNRNGAFTFILDAVAFYLKPDGTATVEGFFLRTPTDADIAAAYGTERVSLQYKATALARLRNAIVGATLANDPVALAAWPAAVAGQSVVAGGPPPSVP